MIAAAGTEGSTRTAAILRAIKAEAAAAAEQNAPSKMRKRRQQQQQQEQQQVAERTDSPLGRAATRLLREHLHGKLLPGLPNEEQLQYYKLADKPFSAGELVQLPSHYLTPKSVRTVQADSSAASRGRESRHVKRMTRAEQQHAPLAPGLLRLRNAVYVFKHSTSTAEIPAAAVPQNPAASKLLPALRCLSEWAGKMAQQQDPPLLLQLLLLGKLQEDYQDNCVVSYINLATDDDREQEQQRQQQLCEKSGEDCLMVHAWGLAAPGASAAVVAIKMEPGV